MRDPALDASLLNAALNNKLEEARQLIARGRPPFSSRNRSASSIAYSSYWLMMKFDRAPLR